MRASVQASSRREGAGAGSSAPGESMSLEASSRSGRRLALALPIIALVAAMFSPGAAVAKPAHYPKGHHRAVCATVPAREARCHAQIVTDAGGTPLTSTTPVAGAYGPSDLTGAYNLPGGGSGQTVAIVDAYDDP